MSKQSSSALLLFTKEAELGKVKSRLASSIGKQKALEVYQSLLIHTAQLLEVFSEQGFSVYLYFAEEPKQDTSKYTFATIKTQNGADLGERMHHAFEELFQVHNKVVILGGDCPELQESDILTAFDHLNQNTSVIGPSTDGGYYLLGLHKLIPELFQKKSWSTVSVLKDSLKNLDQLQEPYFLLEKKTDIDTLDDLILAKASHLL